MPIESIDVVIHYLIWTKVHHIQDRLPVYHAVSAQTTAQTIVQIVFKTFVKLVSWRANLNLPASGRYFR